LNSRSTSSQCGSTDHSDCIPDHDIENRRRSDISKFGVESKSSEIDDHEITLPQDDDICDLHSESEGSSNQFEFSDEERSENDDTSSERQPWDFPKSHEYRGSDEDQEVWEINENKRIRRSGSWRLENENLDRHSRRGSCREDEFHTKNVI
jgi:hypothetical protein